MGAELVQGTDMEISNGQVMIRTTSGTEKVDVIYRRVDDDFIDPLSFNSKSMLGTPGLFDTYRKGNIVLANAPGAGIADDKAIYSYMPEIIKFYTGETCFFLLKKAVTLIIHQSFRRLDIMKHGNLYT